jgi:(E)-4-hydroxy-3-methylbut-2-enyl-diphosphate synthase
LQANEEDSFATTRAFFFQLANLQINCPVIIKRQYNIVDLTVLQLHAATDFGSLLIDGYSDGVCISTIKSITPRATNAIAFGLLQASRMRISKTEYISCPSCGRTLFDLQETTQLIRSKTDHLKGLKIGIMGCIVNGPGEMADADYGYVGAGPGKITLYRGMDVVRKNVNTADAVDGLIEIIKEDNLWVEKP